VVYGAWRLAMNGLSGGSGKSPVALDFKSCNAQPRKVSRVPAVSPWVKTPTVAASFWPASVPRAVASSPTTLVSSATQLLIADGVMVSGTDHSSPSCSSEIGGYIRPARAFSLRLPARSPR
jgi:hypothetical protein